MKSIFDQNLGLVQAYKMVSKRPVENVFWHQILSLHTSRRRRRWNQFRLQIHHPTSQICLHWDGMEAKLMVFLSPICKAEAERTMV